MPDHPPRTDGDSPPAETTTQPTRGADRNRSLADDGLQAGQQCVFPTLEAGLTLLDITADRGVAALHSLVLDHLLVNSGPAYWVDANGYATTTTLARIAPSRRLLDRIHVARGFTAYQHFAAIDDLSAAIADAGQASPCERTAQETAAPTDPAPSLIVVPALDARYRASDTLPEQAARTLQARSLARLRQYATTYSVPVLVTRSTDDEFTAPIATAVDRRLVCEQTQMGPRFTGEDFETLVYPTDGGSFYQTTLAYWRQLLEARATQVGLEAAPTPSTASAVGQAATTDGEATEMDAAPLADVWHSTNAG